MRHHWPGNYKVSGSLLTIAYLFITYCSSLLIYIWRRAYKSLCVSHYRCACTHSMCMCVMYVHASSVSCTNEKIFCIPVELPSHAESNGAEFNSTGTKPCWVMAVQSSRYRVMAEELLSICCQRIFFKWRHCSNILDCGQLGVKCMEFTNFQFGTLWWLSACRY